MNRPGWIDGSEYPFDSHYLALPMGRMHYVDEGSGSPIVMVHGTPTWSFLYRKLIAGLARHHRVIAPDSIGFGLSDKPVGWSYRPQDHAANITALIEHLGLRDVTLMVHDFGGPIGLAHAIEHPEEVARIVIFNSWMWSLRGNPAAEKASRIVGSAVGKLLYTRMNFSTKTLIKTVFGDKRKLTREAHRHYIMALGSPSERIGAWTLGKELIGSSDWYASLWERRERIARIPALLLWGMKDPTFKEADLERWRGLFTDTSVVTYPGAGHFVQEEEGSALVPVVERFIAGVSGALGLSAAVPHDMGVHRPGGS
jgi:haloalkane dehalogenase